jgi:Leucine-rich repeat (LRR) protein
MMQVKRGLWVASVAMLTMLTTGCLGDPPVAVRDPNLESAIRVQIGQPFGFLTRSSMARLVTLDARNLNIFTLEGLQHATNLRFLDVSNNNISDISPLTGLGASLETLDLENNDIFDITAIKGLVFLRNLNICGNRITSLNALAVNAAVGAGTGDSTEGLGFGDVVVFDCSLEEVDPVSVAILLDAGVELACCS